MDDLRIKISLAAQELFLTEGIESVSMRKVAEKVGVTATAIYRHFDDKDALLEEIVNAGLTVLSRYLEPALSGSDPIARLGGLAEAYLRFAVEQPKYFDLAFMVPWKQGRISDELDRHNRATFRLAVEQVVLLMDQGIVRRGDPIETAVHLWATAHGLISLHRTNRLGLEVEPFRRLFHDVIARTIEGLAPAAVHHPTASPTRSLPSERRSTQAQTDRRR